MAAANPLLPPNSVLWGRARAPPGISQKGQGCKTAPQMLHSLGDGAGHGGVGALISKSLSGGKKGPAPSLQGLPAAAGGSPCKGARSRSLGQAAAGQLGGCARAGPCREGLHVGEGTLQRRQAVALLANQVPGKETRRDPSAPGRRHRRQTSRLANKQHKPRAEH